jgi:hypothetical protein
VLAVNDMAFFCFGTPVAPESYTVKKVSGFPVPSQDVTNQTLPSREQFNYNYILIIPGKGEFLLVTSWLGTENPQTFFTAKGLSVFLYCSAGS